MSVCGRTYRAKPDHYVRWETFGHVCDLLPGHLGSCRCRCGKGWAAWSWMHDPDIPADMNESATWTTDARGNRWRRLA